MKIPPLLIAGVLLLCSCQSSSSPTVAAPDPAGTLAVADVDEAPQRIGRGKHPNYPFEMRRAGKTGVAMVRFVITSEGKVINAVAVEATHPLFAAAAVEAVSQWRYQPATKQGQPVNCFMQVPIVFNLNETRR